MTGTVADGTVLTTGTTPEMTRSAVDRIRAAREEAGRAGEHEVVVFVHTEFGEGAAARMEAEFDRWSLEGERRFAALGSDDEIVDVVQRFAAAGAGTVLLQSRSHEPDLEGWTDAAGRIAARLRERDRHAR